MQKSAIFARISGGRILIRSAKKEVGLDTDLAQLLDAVLRGLGFQLPADSQKRDQSQMEEQDILLTDIKTKLPDGFQKRQRLDIAHGSADLDDGQILALGDPADAVFDFLGDVGNDLHGSAEVLTAPLLGDDGLVNLSRRDAVLPFQIYIGEALVMAEVQVGLRPILGHEDLAVLKGVHRSGIHVQIGIHLHQSDIEASIFQKRSDRCGG